MDSAKINDWLQVVGLFGVIASLIFVGLQMQQDRKIALVSIYQARATASAEANHSIAANEDVLRSIIKERFSFKPEDLVPEGAGGMPKTAQPLTALELMSRIFAERATWYNYDNSHFQYQEGYLPESHWIRTRMMIRDSLQRGGIARWMFDQTDEFQRPEFRDEILAIIREIDESEK